tara:strand:- start:332 stop:1345 length:1014 start_codon:yes stop_codon:yes gene_type:complete
MAKRARAQKVEIAKPRVPKGWDATHRFIRLQLTHSGTGEDFHYVDIARIMSAINRRLYRQGMVYHVANVQVQDSQGACEFRFGTIPNTWYFRKAWHLIFNAWKKQRANLLDVGAPYTKSTGKWSDFKVYINKDHISDVDWPEHKDIENDEANDGEWNYADVSFTKDGTDYQEHAVVMMGPHDMGNSITGETTPDDTDYDGVVSAIEAMYEVWNRPKTNNPEVPAGFPDSLLHGMNLGAMAADATLDDMMSEIAEENDSAPYNAAFPGRGSFAADPWVVRETDLDGTGDTMAYVGGFPVPLGLLCIETQSGTNGNVVNVTIELAPGEYKGVAATPMWS